MGKTLPKSVRIYALSVCFAAMGVGSVSLCIALYDVLQYSFPEAMHPQISLQMQSAVTSTGVIQLQAQNPNLTEEQKELLDQQLQAMESVQSHQLSYAHFKARALESLIASTITLIVSLIVFLFHWRLATHYQYADDA